MVQLYYVILQYVILDYTSGTYMVYILNCINGTYMLVAFKACLVVS